MLTSAKICREQSKAKRDGVKTYGARLYTKTLCTLQVEQDESKWSWATSLLGKEPWPLTLLGRDVNEARRHDYDDPIEGNRERANDREINRTIPRR